MTTELSSERAKAQRGFVKMMTSELRRREHPIQLSSKPAVVCLDTDRWQDVIANVVREGSELIGVSTTGLVKGTIELRLLNCASGTTRRIPGHVEEVPVHQDAEVKMVLSLIDQAAAAGVAVIVVPASNDDDLAPLEVQSVEVAHL